MVAEAPFRKALNLFLTSWCRWHGYYHFHFCSVYPYMFVVVANNVCTVYLCTAYPTNLGHNQQTNCASWASISIGSQWQLTNAEGTDGRLSICVHLHHTTIVCIQSGKRLMLETERRFSDVCQSGSSGSSGGGANHCGSEPSPDSSLHPPSLKPISHARLAAPQHKLILFAL